MGLESFDIDDIRSLSTTEFLNYYMIFKKRYNELKEEDKYLTQKIYAKKHKDRINELERLRYHKRKKL
jgi:hypothetical protein